MIQNDSSICLMFIIQMSPAFQLVNQKSGSLSLRTGSLSGELQSSALGYFPRTILKIDKGKAQSIRTIADYVTVSVQAYANNSVQPAQGGAGGTTPAQPGQLQLMQGLENSGFTFLANCIVPSGHKLTLTDTFLKSGDIGVNPVDLNGMEEELYKDE